MNSINVAIDIDTLHCFDEGDGWGSAEPYVWTVFFLNQAVQRGLDNLIGTLGIVKPEPTDNDIASIELKVAQAVNQAIADHVSTWDWIKAFGNMDDKIGTAVFRFSHSELESSTPTLRILRQRWRREGDWEIRGELRATAA